LPNPNKNKTYCPKGHPLKEGNLVLSVLKQGKRSCLTCRREGDRKRRNPDGNISPAVLNSQKTHCPNGHPLEGDNLLPYELKQGKRSCRTCKNESNKKRKNPDGRIPLAVLNSQKTHCPNGHPLEGDNLLPSYLKRGQRVCRTCKNVCSGILAKTSKRKLYIKNWQANKYATNDEWRERVLENNANWRSENPRSGASYSFEEQIAMSIRRTIDNNQCQWQVVNPKNNKSQICRIKASKKNSIHVNHIFSRAKYPELKDNPKFMICYCVDHHADWHLAKGEVAISKLIRSRNVSKKQSKINEALDILKIRFAKGEITLKEFNELKDVL